MKASWFAWEFAGQEFFRTSSFVIGVVIILQDFTDASTLAVMFAWKRDQAASVDWHSLLHQMPADVLILELSTGLVCFFALP